MCILKRPRESEKQYYIVYLCTNARIAFVFTNRVYQLGIVNNDEPIERDREFNCNSFK